MGMLLCEHNFRDVWSRNESARAEIGQILHARTHTHTHTHTHARAAKLVVRCVKVLIPYNINAACLLQFRVYVRDKHV